MFWVFLSFAFSDWEVNSYPHEGENITCGDTLCTGLCMNYINHSRDTEEFILFENASFCYTGNYNLCYSTKYLYYICVVVFLLPTIIVYIYACFKRCFILKTVGCCDFVTMTTCTVLGTGSLGIFISSLYCTIVYENKFENLASGLISGFTVLFAMGMILSFSYCNISPLTSINFMGRDIYTINELTEKITDIRTTPPFYKIFHESHKEPKTLYKEVEYATWEEKEEFAHIPTDHPVCVIFENKNLWSNAMINEFNDLKKNNQGIFTSQSYIDANLDPLIAGNDVPFVIKLLSRRYMKVFYVILCVFSSSFLMDLIFLSNCEVIQVKSTKQADIEPTYRAKYGEKDLEAPTFVLNYEKAEYP